MKLTQTKLNKTTTKKEIQEFQELWRKAQKELGHKAKSTEDKLFADFLANNYLDNKTGLITNKQTKESSLVAC